MALVRTALRRLRTAQRRSDGGFTIVEFLVAMGIFTGIIGVLMVAVTTMTSDVVKASNLSMSAESGRRAFARLDRQVRYATSINRPVLSGTTWYVEFVAPNKSGTATCHQWRLVTSTDQLQQRSWTSGSTPTSTPSWETVATNVVNNPSTQKPFTFVAASTTVQTQGLDLLLVVTGGSSRGTGTVTIQSSLSARNATLDAATTNDDADGDGDSDTEVCTEVSRS